LENKRRISKGILVYDDIIGRAKYSNNRFKSNLQEVKEMKNGKCTKCGSIGLTPEKKARIQGTEGLMMISCTQCRFVELYVPDVNEKSKQKRNLWLIHLSIWGSMLAIIFLTVVAR
jgi:predicted nucleic-acid-binding Zn-ribbon protein